LIFPKRLAGNSGDEAPNVLKKTQVVIAFALFHCSVFYFKRNFFCRSHKYLYIIQADVPFKITVSFIQLIYPARKRAISMNLSVLR
jgi:hypothetical protein